MHYTQVPYTIHGNMPYNTHTYLMTYRATYEVMLH